jgi:hypothetical protein
MWSPNERVWTVESNIQQRPAFISKANFTRFEIKLQIDETSGDVDILFTIENIEFFFRAA